ncbi:hypothetical protein Taro_023088, partial [Colocasia esculenta]|nr:hypothetical protein [Colocasia esculenta]
MRICALVVLVEVLPEPACVASAVLLATVFSLKFYCIVWLGCILVRFSQDVSWRFWWRFSPKLPGVCFGHRVVPLTVCLAVALA